VIGKAPVFPITKSPFQSHASNLGNARAIGAKAYGWLQLLWLKKCIRASPVEVTKTVRGEVTDGVSCWLLPSIDRLYQP
jgi:hypothetical protein